MNSRLRQWCRPYYRRSAVRMAVSALFALLAYGAWAYWVNRGHGHQPAILAALTQGGYSLLLTLILSLVIEYLFRCLRALPLGSYLLGLVTCLVLYTVSWAVNYWAGTPEIVMTLLPGAIIGTVYTWTYIATLRRLQPLPINEDR